MRVRPRIEDGEVVTLDLVFGQLRHRSGLEALRVAVGEEEVGDALAVVAGVDPLDVGVEVFNPVPHHGQLTGATNLVELCQDAQQWAANGLVLELSEGETTR